MLIDKYNERKNFLFDDSITNDTENIKKYDLLMRPLLKKFAYGENINQVTYGQKGIGKTQFLQDGHKGWMIYAIKELLQHYKITDNGVLSCSVVKITNDKVIPFYK